MTVATEDSKVTFPKLTLAQADAIYAALRLLAGELATERVSPADGNIGDILTNSGAHAGLNSEEVHDLCDELLGANE